MLEKIRDFMDTDVCMIILIDNVDDLKVMANAMCHAGLGRMSYEVYKDDITAYMVEFRMPHNRYLEVMRYLRVKKYNLRPESKADVINRLIKD